VFHQLWKSQAPSKVLALSWKLLLDRIPTWLNLSRRNALPLQEKLHFATFGNASDIALSNKQVLEY